MALYRQNLRIEREIRHQRYRLDEWFYRSKWDAPIKNGVVAAEQKFTCALVNNICRKYRRKKDTDVTLRLEMRTSVRKILNARDKVARTMTKVIVRIQSHCKYLRNKVPSDASYSIEDI